MHIEDIGEALEKVRLIGKADPAADIAEEGRVVDEGDFFPACEVMVEGARGGVARLANFSAQERF